MSDPKDKWKQPEQPPSPLFTGQKERDLVKQVNDELIEKVIGQQILYYSIDMDTTNFHPLYGEAIEKTYLPPVRVYALVEWKTDFGKIMASPADRNLLVLKVLHKAFPESMTNDVTFLGWQCKEVECPFLI